MENNKIKIIFIGIPEFGAAVLDNLKIIRPDLVITQPDKVISRKKIIAPVKIAARKHKLSILEREQVSKEEILKINPDLIIVAGYGKFISSEILNIPKYGCLNVHPSLLPQWKGSSPIQHAILNNDKKTGTTIILMNKKMDAGPIIAQETISIEEKDDALTLSDKTASLGAKLLDKIIPQWINNKIQAKEQKGEPSLARKFRKEDGKINWSKTAKEIERQIRAFNPWPSSFCKYNGETLKIWKASISEQEKRYPLGKTLLAPYDKIAVQTKQDYLIIEKLQLEGKKIISSEDFLKGHQDLIGTILK